MIVASAEEGQEGQAGGGGVRAEPDRAAGAFGVIGPEHPAAVLFLGGNEPFEATLHEGIGRRFPPVLTPPPGKGPGGLADARLGRQEERAGAAHRSRHGCRAGDVGGPDQRLRARTQRAFRRCPWGRRRRRQRLLLAGRAAPAAGHRATPSPPVGDPTGGTRAGPGRKVRTGSLSLWAGGRGAFFPGHPRGTARGKLDPRRLPPGSRLRHIRPAEGAGEGGGSICPGSSPREPARADDGDGFPRGDGLRWINDGAPPRELRIDGRLVAGARPLPPRGRRGIRCIAPDDGRERFSRCASGGHLCSAPLRIPKRCRARHRRVENGAIDPAGGDVRRLRLLRHRPLGHGPFTLAERPPGRRRRSRIDGDRDIERALVSKRLARGCLVVEGKVAGQFRAVGRLPLRQHPVERADGDHRPRQSLLEEPVEGQARDHRQRQPGAAPPTTV